MKIHLCDWLQQKVKQELFNGKLEGKLKYRDLRRKPGYTKVTTRIVINPYFHSIRPPMYVPKDKNQSQHGKLLNSFGISQSLY